MFSFFLFDVKSGNSRRQTAKSTLCNRIIIHRRFSNTYWNLIRISAVKFFCANSASNVRLVWAAGVNVILGTNEPRRFFYFAVYWFMKREFFVKTARPRNLNFTIGGGKCLSIDYINGAHVIRAYVTLLIAYNSWWRINLLPPSVDY